MKLDLAGGILPYVQYDVSAAFQHSAHRGQMMRKYTHAGDIPPWNTGVISSSASSPETAKGPRVEPGECHSGPHAIKGNSFTDILNKHGD